MSSRKVNIIFVSLYLLFVALYGSFKLGKWYERQQIKGIMQSMYYWTTDADFFLPNNVEATKEEGPTYSGEVAQGNCIYGPGLQKQTELSKEVGFF